MKDRRKLERFELRLPARIKAEEHGVCAGELNLLTVNVSSDGALFDTPSWLPIGTSVDIDLVLDLGRFKKPPNNKTHVKLTATVVRTEPRAMAVRFNNGFEMAILN
jgi:hypothetical protein